MGSKKHTAPVKAIKAADLVNTLRGQGSYSVFAPTNNAFENSQLALLIIY